MQWQVSLVSLAQPAFDEASVRAKVDAIQSIMSSLSDEDELVDDSDTIALLEAAGRKPIRYA